MNHSPSKYLVIGLDSTWSNISGGLNTVSMFAVSAEDALLSRMRTVVEPPKIPARFVVLNTTTYESRLLEWVPPQPPAPSVREVRNNA